MDASTARPQNVYLKDIIHNRLRTLGGEHRLELHYEDMTDDQHQEQQAAQNQQYA